MKKVKSGATYTKLLANYQNTKVWTHITPAPSFTDCQAKKEATFQKNPSVFVENLRRWKKTPSYVIDIFKATLTSWVNEPLLMNVFWCLIIFS